MAAATSSSADNLTPLRQIRYTARVTEPWRRRLLLSVLLLLAALVFLTGIEWGLPTRDADRYLFGKAEPWSGQQLLLLGGGWDTDSKVGADVDRNPIGRHEK